MPQPPSAEDFATPVHPGEILTEEFLVPLGVTVPKAAARIGIPRDRLAKIAAGRRAVSPDTALRLGRLFGTTAEFWMNLQAAYDLKLARRQVAPALEKIEALRQAS